MSAACRPVDRFAAEKAAMLVLPPIGPSLGWNASNRLARDHYVRIESSDYSVDPAAIGRPVYIHADLRTVTVRWGDRIVARHTRHWGTHQRIHDPAHLATADQMRSRASRRITGADREQVQVRALSYYDRLLGSDEGVA